MASAVSDIGTDDLRREALTHVPGCERAQAPVAVAPLQGGTSNVTFRVQTRLGSFVMRLNEPESEALGVDRHREIVLHRAAAEAGLAPHVVHADARGRFLITEYIAGETWTSRDMEEGSRLARLAEVLRQLHALRPPVLGQDVQPYNLQALLNQHAQRACAASPAEAAYLEALVRRAESSLKSLSARPAAIIHNDIFHGNLLRAGQRLYLVDWEYAALADPLFDLGCLLAYYPAAGAHSERLLAETGLEKAATPAELAEVAWVYVLLSYLWYRTRGQLAPASSQDLEAERALRSRLENGPC
jgi:thiamine kinase